MGFLTEAQVQTFHQDGYLIVRGMYDTDEMQAISAWTDTLAALPETPGKHMMYFETSKLEPGRRILSRIENFYPYHAKYAALFDSDKLCGSIAQLFGEPAVLFKEKINFKLPGGDGFKPHQDVQAGWDKYGSLHISVLISIDRATVENGCLDLAPGSHKQGVVGKMWEPLTAEDIAGMHFAPCPTEPGDVVFFDSYVPHGSGPNLTRLPRRALYVTYNRRAEGDFREQYYRDKRLSYPPDCERETGKTYVFRV